MAIYTNLKANEVVMHGVFESSRLRATDVGKLHDVLVCKEVEGEDGETTMEPIECDLGVGVKVLGFTGDGLQERYGVIAGVGDRISITGNPAIVKSAFTRAQAAEYNFYLQAGQLAKCYQVENDQDDAEIFGIGEWQIDAETTEAGKVAVGQYVVVDGKGGWTAMDDEPADTTYGFIGQVHSLAVGSFYTVVRINCLKNEAV